LLFAGAAAACGPCCALLAFAAVTAAVDGQGASAARASELMPPSDATAVIQNENGLKRSMKGGIIMAYAR
jgi:hypothetical protein